mmetsp:Transcript_75053/g.178449  ORF Transcript_75053/g.178449 Transcript_75053/m.178449 type:complete len:240 (-) Transcript_75053:18-737(-)
MGRHSGGRLSSSLLLSPPLQIENVVGTQVHLVNSSNKGRALLSDSLRNLLVTPLGLLEHCHSLPLGLHHCGQEGVALDQALQLTNTRIELIRPLSHREPRVGLSLEKGLQSACLANTGYILAADLVDSLLGNLGVSHELSRSQASQSRLLLGLASWFGPIRCTGLTRPILASLPTSFLLLLVLVSLLVLVLVLPLCLVLLSCLFLLLVLSCDLFLLLLLLIHRSSLTRARRSRWHVINL